jgi:drug/metabolite transporter (DMT)-like permease
LLLASNAGTGYYPLLASRLSGGWLTAVALLVGGGLLHVPALLVTGQVRLALTTLPLILWLAIVNTARAYTLWTHVLRVLSAFELSVMSTLIPLQTGMISWLIPGNALSWTQVVGLMPQCTCT